MSRQIDKTAGELPASTAPEIFIEHLTFGHADQPLFKDFTFTVAAGQWTCLLGPSGCGKSTLLRLISGSLTQGVAGRRQRALKLLEGVGLGDHSQAFPDSLSGGMRQRAALLRTLMEERPVILMDEPFSALDALTRLKLQNLAAGLVRGATVLLVTHDPWEALRIGHRIYIMKERPVRLSRVFQPPGAPPRTPDREEIASMYAQLLAHLVEKRN